MNKAVKILKAYPRAEAIRAIAILSGIVFLSGCAVHRFQKSEKHGGYVVSRFGYVIPEYTVNLEADAPEDFGLAKARYLRRKNTVETYMIRMGQIESYGRRYVTHFPRIMWSLFANTFKMPFHIFSEYKYEHNQEYRRRIDDLDEKQRSLEEERRNGIKKKLNEFIVKDLEKEKS